MSWRSRDAVRLPVPSNAGGSGSRPTVGAGIAIAVGQEREHPLEWLAEAVQMDPTFVLKAWFGGRSIMLRWKHQLFLTTQGEPWQGVLV